MSEKSEETLVQQTNQTDQAEVEPLKPTTSDKNLIFGILFLAMLFIGAFAFLYFSRENPKTIEGLHTANLNDKLNPEEGRVYGGYSFVNIDGFWYTQLKSPKGKRMYDMSVRYPPWEVKDIKINGNLDVDFFNSQTGYFVTFNPSGKDFSHVALAVGDFNEHMMKVFDKLPTAACDRNQTEACVNRPIVDCESEGVVFYINESDKNKITYDGNCIVIEGKGLDLVKSVNRVLYNLYGILD